MAASPRRDRVLLATALFAFIWTLTTHGKFSNTGDEPHYLTIARSLVRDHDVDLENNYAAADSLTPSTGHVRRALDGTLQSEHDIGFPILLTPVYAIAEQLTATTPSSVLRRLRMPSDLLEYSVVSLALLATVCVAIAWLAAALSHVTSHRMALAVAALVAVSPPILTQSFLIFPETVGLVVMCGVVWWLLTPRPATWTTWVLAAALGYLPWCHRKYSPLVLVCIAIMVWRRNDVVRTWPTGVRAGLVLLVTLPHAAFYWWTWRTWGDIGGPQMLDRVPFALTGIPRGFVGILMDRQYGLVADAPIYLALFACWALATKSTRAWLWVVASLVLPMSAYADWSAGFSPPARYIVPILPFCAVALADSLRIDRMRIAVAGLAAVQVVFTAFAWHHPRSLWPWIDGWNPLLRDLGVPGSVYARWLPMVDSGDWRHTVASAAMLATFNLGLVWIARRSIEGRSPSSES